MTITMSRFVVCEFAVMSVWDEFSSPYCSSLPSPTWSSWSTPSGLPSFAAALYVVGARRLRGYVQFTNAKFAFCVKLPV